MGVRGSGKAYLLYTCENVDYCEQSLSLGVTDPGERLKADQDVTEHAQKHHFVLEAAPDLSQVDELRLQNMIQR